MRSGVAAAVFAFAVVAACSDLDGLSGADPPAGADGGSDGPTPSPDSAASDGNGGDAATATIAAACAVLAEINCSRATLCSPNVIQAIYGGPAACETQNGLACEILYSAPGSLQTPSGVEQCAKDIQALACDAFLTGPTSLSCRPKGTLGDGASCISDAQCTTGFCAEPDAAGCGRCRVPHAVGQDCGSPGCDRGLVCASGKCAVPVGLDQPCTGSADCVRTLHCGPAGNCVPYAAENESCGSGGGVCNPLQALACNTDANSCVKQVAISPGTTCSSINGVGPICLGGLCRPVANTPVCTAFAKEGEACAGLPCSEPYKCVSGQCVKAKMAFCPP